MKAKLMTLILCGLLLTTTAQMTACKDTGNPDDTTSAVTEATTEVPTEMPTEAPTEAPTDAPTEVPTEAPTEPSETETQAIATYETLNGKTPIELYGELLALYQGNYEMTQDMTIVMDMSYNDGMSMHLEMKQKLLMKLDDGNMYSKTETSDMTGEFITEELWYVDGKLYAQDIEGNKIYLELTPEMAGLYYDMDLDEEALMPVPDEWLAGKSFVKTEEGLYALTLELDKDALAQLDVALGEDMSFNAMTYIVNLNSDGTMASWLYTADIEMMGMACTMSSIATLTDAGTTEVTPPADADQYVLYELPEYEEPEGELPEGELLEGELPEASEGL